MRRFLSGLIAIAIITVITLTNAKAANAQTAPPTWQAFTWPLCGRIFEDPNTSWTSGDNCPANRMDNANFTDFPIKHGFGYRNFNDTDRAISFHRGLDFATPTSEDPAEDLDNPVFAAANGYVKSISGSGRDRKITLLHPANGATECSFTNRCRISVYNHVSDVRITATETNEDGDTVPTWVTKGEHIAWTGTSAAGNFDHLHFEIRDPHVRISETSKNTSGRFSYAKDARNPMFYLPYTQLTGAEPLGIQIAEDPTLGDTDVWVNLQANAGYNFNLESVALRAYDGDFDASERDFIGQTSEEGTYVAAYEVNNNAFEIDDWSMQHTPFPTSATSRWNKEKKENPYFDGITPTGPDHFLEQNAGSTFTDGIRYANFDHKLITATPNPSDSTNSSWYQLQIGFTDIEDATGNERCYEADVVTHHPVGGDHLQTVTQCFP
ncbi:MAG: M23 family metallopeptidase [Leptolyngbya sp. SIO1D8]|nr:M23 family metallopeptidase [Leptolyngbya sp. SIO1D8]